MKKVLKYISVFLVSLASVGLLAIGIIIIFINPNHFKPLIVTQAKKILHMDVNIAGDLSWQFFPNIAFKLQHISLQSKDKTNVVIDNASLAVKLLPLLHGEFEMLGFDLTGVSVSNLFKNAELHASHIKLTDAFPVALQLEYQPRSLKKIILKLSGNIRFNSVKDNCVWSEMKGSIANMPIAGILTVTNLTKKPTATGHVSIKRSDLKKDLKNMGIDTTNIQVAENIKGEFDYTVEANRINIQGGISLTQLTANQARLTHVISQIHYQNGVLHLNPLRADLYQGMLDSQIVIDNNQQQPRFSINGKLSNIATDTLIKDITNNESKVFVVGKGSIDFHLSSLGTDKTTITSHLNGTSQFAFQNGILKGVDLDSIINNAYALVNGQHVSLEHADKTNFKSLTGTAIILNGILQNKDLLLDAETFATKGDGTVDFARNTINYSLQTTIKKHTAEQKNDIATLYGVAIPILITNSLENPTVRLDSVSLLRTVAKLQYESAKKAAKAQLKSGIKENIHGLAGDLLQTLVGE